MRCVAVARGLALVAALLMLHVRAAEAVDATPFLPRPAAGPKVVRALTPPDFLDRASLDAFEAATGLTVAADAYSDDAELAQRSAETRYDVVVLRGPALARRIALGALARLDKRRLRNARFVAPAVAGKLAAYDAEKAYSVAFGWSAFGLLYDADKAPQALGGPPVSWAQIFSPRAARRDGPCGIVWPDAREESFLAIWRMQGVDPARARPADVKAAGATLDRARGGFVAFAAPDLVGAFAKGAACLGAGTAGEAAAVAVRGGDNAPTVRFVYPREGAPLALYAFAIPRDAPSPDLAYRLVDALLASDSASRDAESAGVESAEGNSQVDALRKLQPEPVLDAALAAALQSEWKRLATTK